MRTTLFTAAVIGLTALSIVPASAGINRRQAHEQHRIYNGVRSGALTPHETYRLEREQARIARVEHRDRADGDGLSRRERANIARLQHRASRDIYHQKHDGQTRG